MVDIDAYRSWAQEVRNNHNDYVMITPDSLDEILDELATLRTANQWLPIDDAPDDGTDLLVKVTHSLGDGEWETLYWVDWQVADDAWPVFRERIDIPFPPTHYRLIQH